MKPSEKALLPLNRSSPEETELGYYEPQVIPEGKLTLKQAMKLLADNQMDPQVHDVARISNDYRLSKENAGLLFYTLVS